MTNYILNSPDKQLSLQISLENGALFYSVVKNQVTLIETSRIGARLSDVDLTCNLNLVSDRTGKINNQYSIPAFKKALCIDHCNTLDIELEKAGYPMTLETRAYDDGVAFRLVFHKEDILDKEIVDFNIPESIRSVYAMKFRFSYEDEFNRVPLDELYQNLWIFPVLLEANNGVWGLLTEAAVFGDYGGSILSSDKETSRVLSVTAPPNEFTKQKVPVATPWRVILAGSLDAIVNSNTLENLNPSMTAALDDTSFIKPGMVAWSWMTENKSPGDFNRQKDYIDFAADMGWPYICDDGGWKEGGVNIPALVEYGRSKGVGVWIWEHRSNLMNRTAANEQFDRWKKWGVVGIKIDFFESDTRERIAIYDMLAELAAKHHLMINFHGCTKPAGEMRRWPHVLSREGVMGGENFQNFATEYFVQPTARHNCTLPFTRNAVGPMDYTPTTYGTYRTGTTDAHQTALPVVFTSYVTHIAESPEVVYAHPCSEFLKGLPTAWDESRLLEGHPACYVTMARRKDSTWYVGGICASRSRTATVDLSFLDDGEYRATLYQDGMNDLHAVDVPVGVMEPISKEQYDEWENITSRPTSHMHDLCLADISSFTVTKAQKLEIPCLQDGGFAMRIDISFM